MNDLAAPPSLADAIQATLDGDGRTFAAVEAARALASA